MRAPKEGPTAAEKRAYLLAHGWQELKKPNPWKWIKPPMPGRYVLDDAYSLATEKK